MSAKQYSGRLVCDGDGNLLAHEATQTGTRSVKLFDEDGNDTGLEMEFPVFEYGEDHGKPVAYDEKAGGYIFIGKEAPSHNERHGKTVVSAGEGTSGPLYDEGGNLVFPGDPHHEIPVPTDPHYDEHAENKTRLVNDDDVVAATVTGHTEAYSE